MSEVGVNPPDRVRYFIEPESGSAMQERTYWPGDGCEMVSNPMPEGAVELTEQQYRGIQRNHAREVASHTAIVAATVQHNAHRREAARSALMELGLTEEDARIITEGA